MSYEKIEARIEELNIQINRIYNQISKEERFGGPTSKSRKLQKQAEQLINEKWELMDLLSK